MSTHTLSTYYPEHFVFVFRPNCLIPTVRPTASMTAGPKRISTSISTLTPQPDPIQTIYHLDLDPFSEGVGSAPAEMNVG